MTISEKSKSIEVSLPAGLDAVQPDRPPREALSKVAQLALDDAWDATRQQGLMERAARPKRVDPLEQVAWLLEFEGENLGEDPKRPRSPKVLLELGRRAARLFLPGTAYLPQPGDLRAVQAQVKDGLNALRRGEEWKFQPTSTPTAILMQPPRGRDKRGAGGVVLSWHQVSGLIDRLILAMMHALDAAGDRFRLCRVAVVEAESEATPERSPQGCRVFFVARKRQELCPDHAKALKQARMDAVSKRRREERAKLRKRGKADQGRRAKARRRAR